MVLVQRCGIGGRRTRFAGADPFVRRQRLPRGRSAARRGPEYRRQVRGKPDVRMVSAFAAATGKFLRIVRKPRRPACRGGARLVPESAGRRAIGRASWGESVGRSV